MQNHNLKYFVTAHQIICLSGTDTLPDGSILHKLAGLGPGPTLWLSFSDLDMLDVPPEKCSPAAYPVSAQVRFADGVPFVNLAAVADACEAEGLAQSIRQFTVGVIANLSATVAPRNASAAGLPNGNYFKQPTPVPRI